MAEPTSSGRRGHVPSHSRRSSKRAEAFTREPFVLEGEEPAVALAPGTPRRRALDAALAELEAGAKVPSTDWRRALLAAARARARALRGRAAARRRHAALRHQVDALSGTLTALLAEAQRGERQRQRPRPEAAAEPDELADARAPPAIPGEEDADEDDDEDEPDEEPQD